MSDMRTLVNRAFRTYLEPPNARAGYGKLDGPIVAADTTLVVDPTSFAIPEDEELMRQGILLELESELVEIQSYDQFTGTCDVERAKEGTVAGDHADRISIKISPEFSRQSVFDALADNIVMLFPSLHTVGETLVEGGAVAALDDPLAVSIIEAWHGANGHGSSVSGRIVSFHPEVDGRAVVFDGWGGSAWVRYRRRFGSATSEEDTFEELGLDPRWANIAIIGACADLFIGADLEAAQVDWVANVLSAENIQIGSRAQVAGAMLRYREVLMDRAKTEMRSEYKTTMRFRPHTVTFR